MTTERTWESLALDEKYALRQATARLEDDFRQFFGTETIERFLVSSFDQFAASAKIRKFLPLIAERFARQRL